jgi:glycerophosphoryl diester phosphodiesterase
MKRLLLFITFPLAISCTQPDQMEVKIAGHRGGYYSDYPESSFPLYEFIARQFKSDTIIIEIDLRMSRSGTIYLLHDETVDRTTSGTGKIGELDDTYLNTLFLKKENGELTRDHIPIFKDALRFITGKNIHLMLDIKEPIHAEVLAMVKQYGLEHRVIVLTFQREHTEHVAALSNRVWLSALIESEKDWQWYRDIARQQSKTIAYVNSRTPPVLIQELKKSNIQVMADVSEALRNAGKPLDKSGYENKVKDQRLDILITDFPVEARGALRK